MPYKAQMQYGLKWNPNPPLTVPQLVAYALATGIYTILAWVGVIGLPVGVAGVSALFIAVGFGVPFAMWFGGWGLVMGFIGTAVGAGILTGLPIPVALAFGVGDVILYGSLLLMYRGLAPRFGVDPIGRDVFTPKGFIFFFIVAANLPHPRRHLRHLAVVHPRLCSARGDPAHIFRFLVGQCDRRHRDRADPAARAGPGRRAIRADQLRLVDIAL